MLGLSATMDRKDGTTKVFKMFIGEVIHKAERKNDCEVEVRAITYKTNDDEFNETILDYKGQPQISSMICKLCTYNRRTEFIIQTVTDFISVEKLQKLDNLNPDCGLCHKNINYLVKNTCCDIVKYCLPCLNKVIEAAQIPEITIDKNGKEKYTKRRPKCLDCKKVLSFEQNYVDNLCNKPIEELHVIIMSHNLNILEYIYNRFVCKNIASVGYYVGGMSEAELKSSEKKQVILATYSMCSEGLDIPTLNAEFLITPKTDVIQTVGRILRAKHAFTSPIIYDIVDNHAVFQRQWLKRKSYYKKQNYKIIGADSNNYTKDTNEWKTIFEPKMGCIQKKEKDESSEEDDENPYKKSNQFQGKCLLTLNK